MEIMARCMTDVVIFTLFSSSYGVRCVGLCQKGITRKIQRAQTRSYIQCSVQFFLCFLEKKKGKVKMSSAILSGGSNAVHLFFCVDSNIILTICRLLWRWREAIEHCFVVIIV